MTLANARIRALRAKGFTGFTVERERGNVAHFDVEHTYPTQSRATQRAAVLRKAGFSALVERA